MKTYTFEDIRKEGLLLYEYVRGSMAYHTQVAGSDRDTGGVYLEPINQVLGLGFDFQDEIADEKHDNTWYGLKKYMNLLCSSNPNILESLFVDDDMVLYEHPIITEIKQHRQSFITKECFNSFIGYSIAQIKRARGYNKMCVQPITERKEPIDFCFTTYKQGSSCMIEWLESRGLEQMYCGLVSLNNMPDSYGVYYDFGAHNSAKYKEYNDFCKDTKYHTFIHNLFDSNLVGFEWFNSNQKPIGYRGIVREYDVKIPVADASKHKEIVTDNEGAYYFYNPDSGELSPTKIIEEEGVKYITNVINKSDMVRCSSIPKDAVPICTMTYNKDGFTQHCKKYHQYQDWLQKRNQVRYESNLGHNYDSKNMMHSFRLLHMGLEIAETGEFHVNREGRDRDFLLDVRNHKYEYDYLITELEKEKERLDKAIAESTLPKAISREFMNDLLVQIRRKYQL